MTHADTIWLCKLAGERYILTAAYVENLPIFCLFGDGPTKQLAVVRTHVEFNSDVEEVFSVVQTRKI